MRRPLPLLLALLSLTFTWVAPAAAQGEVVAPDAGFSLTIDVEGWELEVLEGLSVDRYRPGVMVLENLFNEKKYRDRLKELNYLFWRRIPPNDVYVRPDLIPGGLARMGLRFREFLVNRGGK